MNLKLHLEHFLRIIFSIILLTWPPDFFKKPVPVYKLYTALLSNLLNPNVKFIAFSKVDISSKNMHTGKYFLEK